MPRLLPRLASSPPSAEPKPPACILYDTSRHRCECRPSAKLCGGRANEPFFQAREGGAKASACHGFKMFTPILSPQCSVPAPAPSQHPHSLLRPPPLSQSKQRSDHLNPTTWSPPYRCTPRSVPVLTGRRRRYREPLQPPEKMSSSDYGERQFSNYSVKHQSGGWCGVLVAADGQCNHRCGLKWRSCRPLPDNPLTEGLKNGKCERLYQLNAAVLTCWKTKIP